jgi:hypothetical protein
MNDKVRKQIESMKKQTIGVEIEMANITRRKAITVIAKFFDTEHTVNHDGGNYDAWSCTDRQGRRWTITRDGSIQARTEEEKAELATPILTYDDLETIQQIARNLRKAGAVSNPEHGCGVHVHIGANGHTSKTLRNLANIMASHEALLTESLNLDRHRIREYCKTVNPIFLKKLNKRKPTTMSGLADLWYEESRGYERSYHYNCTRYHMLNLHATFTKGTVEFRLFQFDNPTANKKGGIHAGQLKSYIQLCLALSEMAKEISKASSIPQQNDNPKYAMRTWLLRLGFIGDEFTTAREMLTKNLRGDAAFRSGRAC